MLTDAKRTKLQDEIHAEFGPSNKITMTEEVLNFLKAKIKCQQKAGKPNTFFESLYRQALKDKALSINQFMYVYSDLKKQRLINVIGYTQIPLPEQIGDIVKRRIEILNTEEVRYSNYRFASKELVKCLAVDGLNNILTFHLPKDEAEGLIPTSLILIKGKVKSREGTLNYVSVQEHLPYLDRPDYFLPEDFMAR